MGAAAPPRVCPCRRARLAAPSPRWLRQTRPCIVSSPFMKTPRGIIFDIDGTLLDSNDAHARAWVEALKDEGFSYTFDDLRPHIGKGGDHILEELAHLDDDRGRGAAISAHRTEIFRERYLPHLAPLPGARDLVLALQARGLKLVVGT